MGSAQCSVDTALELCQNTQRRIVLATLLERQQPATVADLTRAIASHEHDGQTAVSDETLSRIRIALHHVHLPKVAEAGIVEYDAERGVVEPTATLDRLLPQLSAVLDIDPATEIMIDADEP